MFTYHRIIEWPELKSTLKIIWFQPPLLRAGMPTTRAGSSPSQKVALLRCIYTNARSMGDKQEELEATVLVGNHGCRSRKPGGMILMTGVWLLMATNCSEGRKEGRSCSLC